MKSYDVVIIGGGPSGSTAARTLAEKGISVFLFDMKKEIGHPIQCGEAITEFTLKNNNIPQDESWIVQKVNGVKILLPHNKTFYSTVPGLCINRKEFDQWLAKKAIEYGANIQTHTRLKTISGNAGNWVISTSKGTYHSKIIIGADGGSSRTARILNLLQNRSYIKAFQYKFKRKDVPIDESHWLCMSMNEKFHGGYGWIFPRENEFNIGIGSPIGTIDMLKDYCNSLGVNIKKKISYHAGFVPYNFSLSSYTCDGAAIIGDAAGLTNPVTGGGIHAALFSGCLVSPFIIQSLEQEDYSRIHEYSTKIKKTEFLNPIHKKTMKYFKKWTNKDWEFFGNAANGLDMKDLTLWKSFLIGLKYPRYLLRSRELLTIRKEMQINQKYGW